MKKYGVVLSAWLMILTVFSPAHRAMAVEPAFESVIARLQKDDFTKEELSKLYQDPQVAFNVDGVSAFFRHSEGRLNYGQFLSLINITKARYYLSKHQAALSGAQRQFNVDPEVIVAIILVETRLGTYLGKSRVFNILSTMASLQDQDAREKLWREMPSQGRYDRVRFEKKADQRAPWAYDELKAFLRYSLDTDIDPLHIEGSYAGAIGICQFMPSNIARYGADGSGDGRINLFDHTDAIFSVARYLQEHGWKPGLNEAEAIRIVKRYNYSEPYAKTVLGVAQKLKK